MTFRTPSRSTKPAFPPPPSSATFRAIAISFLAVTVLVVVGALWLSSVQARIVLRIRPDVTNVQTAIEVAQTPESGQLQGRVVRGAFDQMDDIPVRAKTGSEQVFTGIVSGTVRLVNNYSRPQTLIKTTRLLTPDGRLYRIDRTITLQPKQTATVGAYADQSGANYALGPAVKMKIPGLWEGIQSFIYAESVSGFTATGGSSRGAVTAEDIESAQATIEQRVYDQATRTLLAELGATTGTKAIFSKRVVEKKANVQAGDAADRFLVSVKLEVTGVVVPRADIEAFVRQKLREKLPSGREMSGFDIDQVSFSIDRAETNPERAKLNISAQTSSKLTAQSSDLSVSRVAGMTAEEAEKTLKLVDGVESVQVDIAPSWIKRLPKSPEKIEVILK